MSQDLINEGIDVSIRPRSLGTIAFSNDISTELDHQSVNELEIFISDVCRSKWYYDEPSGSYYRWEEEDDGLDTFVPTYDLLTPEWQIRVQNIVLLFSDYVVYDATLHDIRIHYADGLQPAMFFRNGQMVSGYWSGLKTDEPLHFLTENELEYNLAPGKSWIIFVTGDSVLMPTSENGWRLEFAIP